MALIDEMRVRAEAGRGGDGVVRWLHLKGKERAGPAGGDGGRGGDIVIEGVRDLAILAAYRFTKNIRAEHGGPGENNNRHGKDGEPYVLKVPIGSSITVLPQGTQFEVLEEGEQVRVLKGGVGGLGNAHFKGAVNQNPRQWTPGKPGERGELLIELKLIADAGIIGFPNAGKSSLLNALTRAKSRVGNYAFTTLDPHLGDFYGYLLADIPGLIEGASTGRGLGSKFLRHIERTKFLIHLVSAETEDPVSSYRTIRAELEAFGHGLSEKPELLVLSKADMLEPEALQHTLTALKKETGQEALALSLLDDDSLKTFSDTLANRLRTEATISTPETK